MKQIKCYGILEGMEGDIKKKAKIIKKG
jgi:hypothetical protein